MSQPGKPGAVYTRPQVYELLANKQICCDKKCLNELKKKLEDNYRELQQYNKSVDVWKRMYQTHLEGLQRKTQSIKDINARKLRAVRAKEFQSKNIQIVDKFNFEQDQKAEEAFIEQLTRELEQELSCQFQQSAETLEYRDRKNDLERRLEEAEEMAAQPPIELLYQRELDALLAKVVQPEVRNGVIQLLVNKAPIQREPAVATQDSEELAMLDAKIVQARKIIDTLRHMIFDVQQQNSARRQRIEHMAAQLSTLSVACTRTQAQTQILAARLQEAEARQELSVQCMPVRHVSKPWRITDHGIDARELLNRVTTALRRILFQKEQVLLRFITCEETLRTWSHILQSQAANTVSMQDVVMDHNAAASIQFIIQALSDAIKHRTFITEHHSSPGPSSACPESRLRQRLATYVCQLANANTSRDMTF